MFNECKEEIVPSLCLVGNTICENKFSKYKLKLSLNLGGVGDVLQGLNALIRRLAGGIEVNLEMDRNGFKCYQFITGGINKIPLHVYCIVKGDEVYLARIPPYACEELTTTDTLEVKELLDNLLYDITDLNFLEWVCEFLCFNYVIYKDNVNVISKRDYIRYSKEVIFLQTSQGFEVKDIVSRD